MYRVCEEQVAEGKDALVGQLAEVERAASAFRADATTKIADLEARLVETSAANADAIKSMRDQVRVHAQ